MGDGNKDGKGVEDNKDGKGVEDSKTERKESYKHTMSLGQEQRASGLSAGTHKASKDTRNDAGNGAEEKNIATLILALIALGNVVLRNA